MGMVAGVVLVVVVVMMAAAVVIVAAAVVLVAVFRMAVVAAAGAERPPVKDSLRESADCHCDGQSAHRLLARGAARGWMEQVVSVCLAANGKTQQRTGE